MSVIEIGVAKARVLGKYEREVQQAREFLAVQEARRDIAAEGVLAGLEVVGRIVKIDEVAGTIETEDA